MKDNFFEKSLFFRRPLRTEVSLLGRIHPSNTEIILAIMKFPLNRRSQEKINIVPIDFCLGI
ncbi:hypothetical protein A3I18_01220 [Candidatus Campbellbacteria bacterium RIFCSPLOWO2_02_FULL_35_11]|uniref:Uncharacterized protein n=1 Tax=Candidatus Campbellbacteria bacterium RIFCSPLOWO2_02_FULL_35_11 TaxID=1797581 RepID=A0A1F5ETX2_9BACT|nr:MAG: hypothetical protein A3I18_01220 [Candidatus Campbellbacteria bacterium RIFCSPLOWO2_02_FULL_35_11]